jgi:phosphate-selective porin OprO/OprP
MRPIAVYTATIFGLVLLVSASVHAQDNTEQDNPSVFRWRNRPSLQFGDLRLDLRAKIGHDWREFDPEIDADSTRWRHRRGGINGEIGGHIEFQIERDFHSDGEWRDVFVSWTTFRQASITGGRFKVPFGREQLVSSSDVDFAERALVSNTIPPARDRGVMIAGRFLQRGVTYEFGVFEDDGDNGVLQEPQFAVSGDIEGIGPSFAGRITGTPLRAVSPAFDTLRVGFSVGASKLPEGLNSLRGESYYGTVDFFEPVYVKGRRTRMGVDAIYAPGPFSITAEWIQAWEQRKNQGLGDMDLSDLISSGWYTAATWFLTGEDKEEYATPRRPLFEGGIGAIELAVRYETLGFESADKSGPAFSNPRAEHILGNTDRIWTFGLNWFANRWVRTVVNAIREEFDDPARSPIPGTATFWSGIFRLQVVF